jgi:hypothetical protein
MENVTKVDTVNRVPRVSGVGAVILTFGMLLALFISITNALLAVDGRHASDPWEALGRLIGATLTPWFIAALGVRIYYARRKARRNWRRLLVFTTIWATAISLVSLVGKVTP